MTPFLSNLGTVAEQVFILFLLMLIGFFAGKTKIFNDNAAKTLADFCLKFATPAVIIKSFIRKFDGGMAKNLLLAILAATVCHLIAVGIATAIFRGRKSPQRALLRNSSVLSNAGFMGMPLQAALLGTIGTFYGAAYVIVLTLFIWSYAFITMSGGTKRINALRIVFNPGIIAVIIGLPIFLFSVQLPEVIDTTVTHIANLNTPLPMIVVGYYLAGTSFKKAFSNKKGFLAITTRLVIIPLVCIPVLYLLGFRGDIFVSTIISASAPIAVAVTMFSAMFDNDAELSANTVSVSTLFSIATMPLIVALAQTIK